MMGSSQSVACPVAKLSGNIGAGTVSRFSPRVPRSGQRQAAAASRTVISADQSGGNRECAGREGVEQQIHKQMRRAAVAARNPASAVDQHRQQTGQQQIQCRAAEPVARCDRATSPHRQRLPAGVMKAPTSATNAGARQVRSSPGCNSMRPRRAPTLKASRVKNTACALQITNAAIRCRARPAPTAASASSVAATVRKYRHCTAVSCDQASLESTSAGRERWADRDRWRAGRLGARAGESCGGVIASHLYK